MTDREITHDVAEAQPAGASRLVRVRPTDLASRRAGDEVVILDLTASSYHALNASGGLLWEAMADWTSTDRLTAMLADSFGLTAHAAGHDVATFVDGCVAAGLVEIRPDP